ncbi:hypothetical protein [Falsiroseomonas sp. CW058]|uniref:hypothetical protein n=1 Tax=Falsiroseomonas sp. CW058 TaxID=3388664 RepID=UPI003D313F77
MAQLLNPVQVVFIHLPKTGGMSLHGAIAAALPPGATLRVGDAAERAAFLRLGPAQVASRAFVSGHVSFEEAVARSRPDARFVALLRDPVARLVSAFNYMASWTAHPLHAAMRDRGFADFVLDSGDALSGEACRQLTGRSTAAGAIPLLEACYAAVATTDRLGELAALAGRWLGLPRIVAGRENVTPGQGRMTLDSRSCQRLLDVTQEDRLLFEHVAQRHGGLLAAPGMRA